MVSHSPSLTLAEAADVEEQTVVRGILLKYHPNGSLEDALSAVTDILLTLPAVDANTQSQIQRRHLPAIDPAIHDVYTDVVWPPNRQVRYSGCIPEQHGL